MDRCIEESMDLLWDGEMERWMDGATDRHTGTYRQTQTGIQTGR